ncbi:transposase family protein [Planktothrix sp. FACHB-1355]|uniref:transposase family protein n=1 Tax=Planktothrix sp. FACHB-1355 TaxID=2692854 RepID=UPI0018EFA78B|nr:transposase family protein [Planktothrix sp. FACHB-1355]
MMKSPLDTMLNIAGTTVESFQQVEGYICLHIKMLNRGMQCPYCQRYTEKLHQTTYILARDLPSFGQPVYLKVPRRRFYCRRCQKYSTERLDFMDWQQVHTQRYEQNIYQRVLASNVEQVSREEGLTGEEIEAIFWRVNQTVKKKIGVGLND